MGHTHGGGCLRCLFHLDWTLGNVFMSPNHEICMRPRVDEDRIGDAKNILTQVIRVALVQGSRKLYVCSLVAVSKWTKCLHFVLDLPAYQKPRPTFRFATNLRRFPTGLTDKYPPIRVSSKAARTFVTLVEKVYNSKVSMFFFILQHGVYAKPPNSVPLRYRPESNLDTRMWLPPSFR